MLGFALLLMLGVGLVSDAKALIEHRQSWNTNGEEAVLAGYDVVVYHRLGKATMGSPEFMAEWMGGVFLFANKAHLKAFLKDSRKYAPHSLGAIAVARSHTATPPRLMPKMPGRFIRESFISTSAPTSTSSGSNSRITTSSVAWRAGRNSQVNVAW
jgi:hypothetical protein